MDALEAALRDGFDPELDAERSRLVTATGEILIMPSTIGAHSGVKLLSSTPDNATRNQPLLQGGYLLFEGDGQRPAALIDGTALTILRTAAASALAVRHLLVTDRPLRVVVFGTGPQARGHASVLRQLHDVAELTIVGRDRERAARLAEELGAVAGEAEAVAAADVVCCCTTAMTPLFDGSLIRRDAVVVAMGSHSPDARETDDTLIRRSSVVVEGLRNTLVEAGDIVIPTAAGVIAESDLVTLRDVVTGRVELPTDRPRLFKGTGMPWQDLVVAVAEYAAQSA